MNLDPEKLKAATVDSAFAREAARINEERSSWRNAMAQTDSIAKQFKELTQVGSTYAQIAGEVKVFRSAASIVGDQYRDLLGAGSTAVQTIKAWQESQRTEQEQIRKMLAPLADIRRSLMLDDTTQRLMKEVAMGASVRGQYKDVLDSLTGVGSVAKMWAQQIEDSRGHARKLFENLGVGTIIQSTLKDFEHINKQWRVPSEMLGVLGSLKELQSQIGKVAFPTIDWGSAAALAKLLGEEGLEEQLAHLGIEPNGSLLQSTETPEKGLLSRKQSDAVALLGLLLSLLSIWMAVQMFDYQENAGAAQQGKNDEQSAKQLRQLESLNRLVEKTLVQAVKQQEERFVVRERTATVRSKPKYGAAVEGKLMPNEVVRAIDKDGKWIEVEYYHWLHEEYRTGWVLKKYLERVPANHSKKPAD